MRYCDLNSGNIELYLAYLKEAFTEEPQEMTAEAVDEEGIRRRIQDPFYQKTKSILAIENEDGAEKAVGRLEYHFYGCLQDGYRMAYVDWVYIFRLQTVKGAGAQKKNKIIMEKEQRKEETPVLFYCYFWIFMLEFIGDKLRKKNMDESIL